MSARLTGQHQQTDRAMELCIIVYKIPLEIRSVERGICPNAVLYIAVKRYFFNI